ncbi:hypothetical protein BH10BAC4_BH10BAC4_04170 [soil metagenome]
MESADWIGFTGVSILLVAFLLNLLKKLEHNSILYVSLNFVGAALAGLASILIHYVPFIILEGTWTLVSLIALIQLLLGKKK